MSLVTPEAYVDQCSTTVASGGYTAGSGVLNVASTGSPFPASNQFHFYIADVTTKAVKAIGKATAINSGTQWAVSMTLDANANQNDTVVISLCAGAMDQIRADQGRVITGALPSGQKGDALSATDDVVRWVHNGSSFIPFGPSLPLTNPNLTTFAWLNQGSATVTARAGSMLLSTPAASGNNLKGQEITAPSTPYSIVACVQPLVPMVNFTVCGMYFRDHTSGKLVVMNLAGQGGGSCMPLIIQNYTSPTVFSANAQAYIFVSTVGTFFLKLRDDGTNFYFSVSPNGLDFLQVFQVSRTAFLSSPDRVGFHVEANNSSWPSAMALLSWAQGS